MTKDTKTVGAALCLDFAAACMRQGAIVSEPFGDNAPYDLLVDFGNKIYRVQIKAANQNSGKFNGAKRIPNPTPKKSTSKKPSSKSVAYPSGSIDVVVTWFNSDWFMYPNVDQLKSTHTIRPEDKKSKNAWDVFGV